MLHFRLGRNPINGLLAALALATGLTVAGTRPANALTLTLTADTLHQLPGAFINLTATADQDYDRQFRIMVFDEFGTFLVGQSDPGVRSVTVPVRQSAPTFNVAYIAFVARPARALFPPDIQATSNDVHPNWLNPMRLSAFRLGINNSTIYLFSDSGGAPLSDADHHIEIFNKTTGALVSDCPGGSGITQCTGSENNPSGSTYWAIISLPSPNLQSVNDLRDASFRKCVDSAGALDSPVCDNCDAVGL